MLITSQDYGTTIPYQERSNFFLAENYQNKRADCYMTHITKDQQTGMLNTYRYHWYGSPLIPN